MGHPVPKVDAAVLKRTLRDLDMSVQEFATEARQSPSSVHAWLRAGRAPAYMELVCEALRHRHLGTPSGDEVTLLVKVPEREREMIARFLNAISGRATEIR